MSVKHIDIREFRSAGFLQEANRQFFHPLGLALEIFVNEDGTESLSGVWDYRDDPEGIVYAHMDEPDAAEKAATVEAERTRHADARQALFGHVVQPIGNHICPSHLLCDAINRTPQGES